MFWRDRTAFSGGDSASVAQLLRGAPPAQIERSVEIGFCRFFCVLGSPVHVAMFEQFMPHGGCRWPGGPQVDYRLHCVASSTTWAEIGRVFHGRPPAFTVETFEGDPPLACWVADEIRIWSSLKGAEFAGYFIIQCRNELALVLRSDDEAAQLMRIVREVHLRESEKVGAVALHAAAFVSAGGATLVVGGKARGKTTSVLLALSAGASYLANDRVIVLPAGNRHMAAPFPLAVRVGWGTMGAMPALSAMRWDIDALYRKQDALLPRRRGQSASEAAAFGSGAKVELTPRETIGIFKTGHSSGAPVGRLVFPAMRRGRSGARLTKLEPDGALEALRTQAMTPRDEKWIHPWLVPRDLGPQSVDSCLAALCRSVEAFELAFGTDDFSEAQRELMPTRQPAGTTWDWAI